MIYVDVLVVIWCMDLVEDVVIDLNIIVGIWSRCDGMCRHHGRDLVEN